LDASVILGGVYMSLLFVNTADRVNAGSPAALDALFGAGATLLIWCYPLTAGGNSTGRLFDKTTWIFFGNNSTATNTFTFEHARAGTIGRWRMPSSTMAFSAWQHVAVSYDGSSTTNDPVFYYNGASVTVTEMSTPTSTIADDSANEFYIGNRSGGTRVFDGYLFDARIYNRVLAAKEISTIYACQGHDGIVSGLAARWLFDELPAGTTVTAPVDIGPSNLTSSVGGTFAFGDTSIFTRRRVV
jgi:Concanavalin A-like lectin/glucanases superfamily